MRRGLILTARDHKILAHLLFGPATALNIFKYFFENGKANRSTRWRVMTRRLKKLEQARLIKSTFNPRVNSLIFVLEKAGAECAADKYGVEVSNTICHFSKPANIFHDLIAAGTAKLIVNALLKMDGFRLHQVVSETYIRKESGRPQKGVYYPDLRASFDTPYGPATYDIEIDCGTISKADFRGKMGSFRNTIVLIVWTQERFALLKKYLMERQWNKQIFMSTFNEISSRGFFLTRFWERASNSWRTLL